MDCLELQQKETLGQRQSLLVQLRMCIFRTSLQLQDSNQAKLTLSKLLASLRFSLCSCLSATTAFKSSCNRHSSNVHRIERCAACHWTLLVLLG